MVRQGLGQPAARLQRVDTLIRQHQDRRERQVGGDAGRVRAGAVLPDQADAAVERGREVVGVALERQAEPEQLVGRDLAAVDGRAGDEARGDRRSGGAETALERDPIDEAEAVLLDGRDQRERAQGEVPVVGAELAGALALDDDRVLALLHVQLVPEIERRGSTVEPRPEVRRRRGRADDHPRTCPKET